MINVDNWPDRQALFEQYWQMKNQIPLLALSAPIQASAWPEFNPDIPTLEQIRQEMAATYYGGVAYPYVSPSVGPDLLAALLGLEVRQNESSDWIVHHPGGLMDFRDFTLSDRDGWLSKAEQQIAEYVRDARQGDYIVGMIDLNPGADGLSALIGPEQLCLAMLDEPDEVRRVNEGLLGLYQAVFDRLYRLSTQYQEGTTNWLGLYSQIPWYFLSCDFICMISPEQFEQHFVWEVEQRTSMHPRTLFHLDGENALIHLNRILRMPSLTGVQVQATPHCHSAAFWLPYLRQIQSAGKTICIEVTSEGEVLLLCRELKPAGLFIRGWLDDAAVVRRLEQTCGYPVQP